LRVRQKLSNNWLGLKTVEDPIELRKGFERAGVIAIQAQQDANRATGAAMQDREIEARKWLAEKAAEAEAASSAKRDAREEESLSIAREANRIAERALGKATMANIWAAIATLIATSAAAIAYLTYVESIARP
jgi:hypothetical protein